MAKLVSGQGLWGRHQAVIPPPDSMAIAVNRGRKLDKFAGGVAVGCGPGSPR